MTPSTRMRLVTAVLLATALCLSACASLEDPTRDWGPERLYEEAKTKLKDGQHEEAIKLFETLQARYPYGQHAVQSQLEVAYAYYKNQEPALAVAAADRFVRQHPTHPNVDYAYYLKGLTNFRTDPGLIEWLIAGADEPIDRDPRAVREAYAAFKELVDRFPDSRYAPDAKDRMAYLVDAQARYEILVARYYFDRGAYVATINRCKQAILNHPRAPSVEDALGLQALSYRLMGMNELMEDTLRVLRQNFPESRYLTEIDTLGTPEDSG
jgi:outer membrane protein assembly factor BamD